MSSLISASALAPLRVSVSPRASSLPQETANEKSSASERGAKPRVGLAVILRGSEGVSFEEGVVCMELLRGLSVWEIAHHWR